MFAGGITIDLLVYFVWPTPPTPVHASWDQEPAKTILFLVVLLGCATFLLFALYWTLTPRPLLQVSAAWLIYRPFPFPTRIISWEDVESISAGASRRPTSLVTQATILILTLWFTLKPGRLSSAERDPQPLYMEINLGTLSLGADDLVRLIRTYHDVHVQ